MIIKILVTLVVVLMVLFFVIFRLPAFGAKEISIKNKSNNAINYKDGVFYNQEPMHINIKFTQIVKFLLGIRGNQVKPNSNVPYVALADNHFSKASKEARVTWFGHSAVLLELDEKFVFIDPMLSERASPLPIFGSKRFNNQLPIKLNKLPELDVVLISHDHYDHLDYKTIKKIKHKVKKFIVPLGVASHLVAWGVDKNKVIELDWWQSHKLNTIDFTLTPALHSSGRKINSGKATLWGSYVVKGENSNIFFSGDSGYTKYLKEIGQKYGPFDFAMIECGQYNTQWSSVHMMPEQSVQAALDLKAEVVMPIHWGSFALSVHSWSEPVELFVKNAKLNNVIFTTPMIGQSFTLKQNLPQDSWWQGVK